MSEVIRKGKMLAAVVLFSAVFAAPVGAQPGDDNRVPDLGDCKKLKVEAGNKVAFVAYAEGVQIYRWNGTSWAFVAPEAVLYTGNGEHEGVVGVHYAGPTWESPSGSYVVGTLVDKCTPNADAIPWLLLRAVSSEGPGIFHRVTFIQRLLTEGGVVPAGPGEFVGEEVRVPYTAWYVFYRKHK